MGRGAEFGGGAAYGNFEPEPVDVDLADPKITDHPHYSQPPGLGFHDPDLPSSDTCQACGKHRSLHSRVSLPPTRQGYESMLGAVEGMKTERREGKERGARESHKEDMAMGTVHGTVPHFVRSPGLIEDGPKNDSQLRGHIASYHYLDDDDAQEMEHPASEHAKWHAAREWGGEEHTHTDVHPHTHRPAWLE